MGTTWTFDAMMERLMEMRFDADRFQMPELGPHLIVFGWQAMMEALRDESFSKALRSINRPMAFEDMTFAGARMLEDQGLQGDWYVFDAELANLYLDDAEKRRVAPPNLRMEVVGKYNGTFRKTPRRAPKGKSPRDMTAAELEALPVHPGVTMTLGGRKMLLWESQSGVHGRYR